MGVGEGRVGGVQGLGRELSFWEGDYHFGRGIIILSHIK